ncbi:MAG: hypothetical protein DCC49_11145 [Acidobacteria bacterium]|nr:MAG: hypothetical protein DCC49_11145 [Acidobacteriota bacterium]
MQSKTEEARSLLRCPTCRASLDWSPGAAACTSCSARYPIESGVVRFIDETDDFYEGAYDRQIHFSESSATGVTGKLKSWAFFNLAQSGVIGEVRRVLPDGGRIVDLGCAGGITWFGERGTAIGVELSVASLKLAAQIYAATLQAYVTELPICDESVDVVYSSYLWEHLTPETKSNLLAETARILRPGGSTVIQCDTLGDNLISRYARHDPEKYEKGFIDNDGHIGLEPGSKLLDRLRDAGFTIKRVMKLNTTVFQYPSTYGWLDLSYGDEVKWVRTLGNAAQWMLNSKAGLPIELAVTAFDRAINPISKLDAATRVVVTAVRS